MKDVSLVPFCKEDHLTLLTKWLKDPELMHNWDMNIFKNEEIVSWARDPTRVILIIKDNTNGDLVGLENFYNWNKDEGITRAGILIDTKYQNQGFGKAAIIKSNKYAFEEMGLKRIEIYIEADNERSRHVFELLGYTFDRFDEIKQRYYYHLDRG